MPTGILEQWLDRISSEMMTMRSDMNSVKDDLRELHVMVAKGEEIKSLDASIGNKIAALSMRIQELEKDHSVFKAKLITWGTVAAASISLGTSVLLNYIG